VITYLIVLVDDTLNVSAAVFVDNDNDGPLPDPIIYDRGNNVFDVVYSGLSRNFGFNIDLILDGSRLTEEHVNIIVERE